MLFWLTRNILQDDLDKTIVSVALCCSSTIRGTKRLASLQSPKSRCCERLAVCRAYVAHKTEARPP